MSGIRSITRSKTVKGFATDGSAPIYVDSDDNILKYIPAGAGSTEVQVVDASATQTLTNKTVSGGTITGAVGATGATVAGPTITTPLITGAVGATGATYNGGLMNATSYSAGSTAGATGGTFATGTFAIQVKNGIVTVVG